MAVLACRGEDLDVVTAGQGPTLLLVHSLGTGAWLWQAQIEAWSQNFRVIAVSARGHGGSSNRGGFTVREVAADMLAAARQLGGSPIHLVGISMGGPICAHIVDLAPDDILSLVIACSFADQGEAGAKRADAVAATIRDTSMQAYAQRYAEDTLMPATRPAHAEQLAASMAAIAPENYIEAARAVFTSDVRDLMRRVACPAHIVAGAQDNRTPPALSEEIRKLIPQAGLTVIDGAAHLANLDQPAAFEAAVLPFLRAQAQV